MAALLKNLFGMMGGGPNRPTPVGNLPGYGTRPPTPTPVPNVPDFNPMGKKPPKPTVIPGMAGFGGGIRTPGSGRSLLGS